MQIIGGLVLFLSLTFFGSKYFYKLKDHWRIRKIEKLSKELAECYQITSERSVELEKAECLKKAKGKIRKIKKCDKKYGSGAAEGD